MNKGSTSFSTERRTDESMTQFSVLFSSESVIGSTKHKIRKYET